MTFSCIEHLKKGISKFKSLPYKIICYCNSSDEIENTNTTEIENTNTTDNENTNTTENEMKEYRYL